LQRRVVRRTLQSSDVHSPWLETENVDNTLRWKSCQICSGGSKKSSMFVLCVFARVALGRSPQSTVTLVTWKLKKDDQTW